MSSLLMNLHCTVKCHFRFTVPEENVFKISDFVYNFVETFVLVLLPNWSFILSFSLIVQETKAQFARDDPAFLVLLAAWLVISSVRSYQTQSPRD
jgi:hypothetical protein